MRVITLSSLSLVGGSGIAEAKIPLWWADGRSTSTSSTTPGQYFLIDGSGLQNNAALYIFALSGNWPVSFKYAFEATIFSQSTNTTTASLWNKTSSSQITGSQISTTSSSAIVVRSGQFTLTPNDDYNVSVWSSNTSLAYLIDASLIVFPS